MKRSQCAHLGSMGMKCDTARWHDDICRRRDGTGRRKGGGNASWSDMNLTAPKNKENSHGQFSYYKWTLKI
jgi:hypothetical protein